MPPKTLTVAAASDLAPVESALAALFAQSRPELQIRFVTQSSAALAQQIENGAPYDVFLSANSGFVDRLEVESKLVPDSVRAYVVGRLGLLWRDERDHPFSDLANSAIRIVALPNPKLAPYGVAAQESLEHAGIWSAVQPKVVYGENVRQALQLLESGNADAVLTSNSLLVGKNPTVIDAGWHKPIVQKAGVVAGTPNLPEAEAFLAFLLTPAAQGVFARYGFSKP